MNISSDSRDRHALANPGPAILPWLTIKHSCVWALWSQALKDAKIARFDDFLPAEFVLSITQLFLEVTRQRNILPCVAPIHDSLGAQMSKRCSMCFLVLRVCTDCATNALRRYGQDMPSLYLKNRNLTDRSGGSRSTAFRRGLLVLALPPFWKFDLSPLRPQYGLQKQI